MLMRYKLYDTDNNYVNVIVADEDFITSYCAKNNYTYVQEELPEPEKPEVVEEPTEYDKVADSIQEGINEV